MSYGSVYEAIPGDKNTKIDAGTTCAIKHITEPFASRTMAKSKFFIYFFFRLDFLPRKK